MTYSEMVRRLPLLREPCKTPLHVEPEFHDQCLNCGWTLCAYFRDGKMTWRHLGKRAGDRRDSW